MTTDERFMAAALALAERGRGRTGPNPNVGCVIVKDGRVIGRGWTQPGGRPHAEEVALAEAGATMRGATAYVTLEPCAHANARGPACADGLVEAGVARVVAAIEDPDPRTAGKGFERLRGAGIKVESAVLADAARRTMAGFLTRRTLGRPHVTLKLATSLDSCIALADGSSRWITGETARAHAHLERARHEAILVGRGTWEADKPSLAVRLPGLEVRSPRRFVLSSAKEPDLAEPVEALPSLPASAEETKGGLRQAQPERSWGFLSRPQDIATLPNTDHILVEGGAGAAAAFLTADLIDRLLLYRAPILIGAGKPALGDIGLTDLADARGRWTLIDARMLGSDRLEVYERASSGKVDATFPPG